MNRIFEDHMDLPFTLACSLQRERKRIPWRHQNLDEQHRQLRQIKSACFEYFEVRKLLMAILNDPI